MATTILSLLIITLLAFAAATPSIGYISVSVATLWTDSSKPRDIDAPALTNPVQIQQWLDSMTKAEYLDLTDSDRTQTQALYGTQVHILNSTKGWYEIAVPDQTTPKNALGYPGWVPAAQISFDQNYGKLQSEKSFAQIDQAATAPLYRDPALRRPIINISYATRLPVLSSQGRNRAIQVVLPSGRFGYLSSRSATIYPSTSAIPYPSGSTLITTGKLFLNRPYLWGGTSGFAFDCAGFTGTIYRAHGIAMERDSSAQAIYGNGKSVGKEDLMEGDLIFYATNISEAKSIHHVAMYAGEGKMLEAYAAGTPVRLTDVRYNSEYWGAERYLN